MLSFPNQWIPIRSLVQLLRINKWIFALWKFAYQQHVEDEKKIRYHDHSPRAFENHCLLLSAHSVRQNALHKTQRVAFLYIINAPKLADVYGVRLKWGAKVCLISVGRITSINFGAHRPRTRWLCGVRNVCAYAQCRFLVWLFMALIFFFHWIFITALWCFGWV